MRRTLYAVLTLALMHLLPAQALVKSRNADIDEQGWMANILVRGSTSNNYTAFCKGSLIHEYWVLSSPACFYDPYRTLDQTVSGDFAEYAVALGDFGGFHEVEKLVRSPDGSAMLLRLKNAATTQPITTRFLPAGELEDEVVRIYGRDVTADFGDSFFNPGGELIGSCSVGELTFFNDGRMCFMLSDPEYSLRLQMARGQVIDPESGNAPSSPINDVLTPDTSGKRLYIDFAEHGSYPCHEDIGAPIVAMFDDEPVQVGLVTAVGLPTGVPMCSDSYANYLVTLIELEQFIEENFVQGLFDQQCPATATLNYEQLDQSRMRFYWEAIENAQGYRVLYTEALGHNPVQSIDIGAITEAEVDLLPNVTYSLALQAYNADCTGNMSRPVSVQLD